MEQNPSSSAADRKIIERNRRNHMKALYFKLNSLVSHQTSREVLSLPDQLDEAANYIKKLQIKLEKMKEKRDCLREMEIPNANMRPPQIDIHEMGSVLKVVLITGLDSQLMVFNHIIRMLHQEGAEVFNASFSVTGNSVFHTIHSKIVESSPRYEAARISARLKKFVQGA